MGDQLLLYKESSVRDEASKASAQSLLQHVRPKIPKNLLGFLDLIGFVLLEPPSPQSPVPPILWFLAPGVKRQHILCRRSTAQQQLGLGREKAEPPNPVSRRNNV